MLQPRAMVIGQITAPYFIEPTGAVDCFATRFYPYGLASFLSTPLQALANQDTPLTALFGEDRAHTLAQNMTNAADTQARITVIEAFLFQALQASVDAIVKSTVDAMFATRGTRSIKDMLADDAAKRRQLERKFRAQVGTSPKQLSKVIRLQTVLNFMLHQQSESLSQIAYEGDYFDQAHFTRDFKDFTGLTPKAFFKLDHDEMALSRKFYE